MSLEMIMRDGDEINIVGDYTPKNQKLFDFAMQFLADKYKEFLNHDVFHIPIKMRRDSNELLNMLAGPFTCHFYDLNLVSRERFSAFAEEMRRLPKDSLYVVSHFYDNIHEDRYGVILLKAPDDCIKQKKLPLDKETIEARFKDNKCVVLDCDAPLSDLIRFYDAGEYALNPGTEPALTILTCKDHSDTAIKQYAINDNAALVYIMTQDALRTQIPECSVAGIEEGVLPIHLIVARKVTCGYNGCTEFPVKSFAVFDGEEAYKKDMTKPVAHVIGCDKHISERWHNEFKKAKFESNTLVLLIQDFLEFKPPQSYLIKKK